MSPNMDTALQNKLIEYKKKFINKPGYVVEIGSFDMYGGNHHLFEDADDFCGIDNHRGPGTDIVADYTEVDRLFDFNPDTLICLDVFRKGINSKKLIKAIRETVIPGGILIVFIPVENGGSFADAIFSEYEVYDLITIERTICGIAKKPYKIGYDIKDHKRCN